MSKHERLARLLRIMTLIRSRSRVTRKALAETCEVTVRTIQRDINSLSYAGVPVFWDNTKYQIMPDFYMPPTNLSLDEAVQLIAASRTGVDGREECQQQTVESAISKIMAGLPVNILHSLEATLEKTVSEDSLWLLSARGKSVR